MKKVSKIFCAISAAAVMLMSGVAVSAESEYKLYDEAGLLAEEDAREIETRLEEIAYTYSQDVIVYTTDDLEGYEVESYNERLASELDAGINGSGIIYLVAMNERKYDIYAFGQMKDEIMIKSIRNDLASDLQPYLTDGEYYTAFMGYADKVEEEIYNVYENGPNAAFICCSHRNRLRTGHCSYNCAYYEEPDEHPQNKSHGKRVSAQGRIQP